MPIVLDLANLIVKKSTIEEKYHGGVGAFRERYIKSITPKNSEDNMLFSLVKMNADEFDIDELIDNGLSFNENTETSNDFTIYSKYGGAYWELENLNSNALYVWHKQDDELKIVKARYIGEVMLISEIQEAYEQGKELMQNI